MELDVIDGAQAQAVDGVMELEVIDRAPAQVI